MKQAYLMYDEATPVCLVSAMQRCLEARFLLHRVTPDQLPELSTDDFLIFAPGAWTESGSGEALRKILLHVIRGGSMLVLHPAFETHRHELDLMCSARLLRKMPYGQISILPTESPLARGLDETELWDVPMLFDRSAFDDSESIVNLRYGKSHQPLIWRRSWFLGTVYCAAVGSTEAALQAYRPVLENIACRVAEGGVPRG